MILFRFLYLPQITTLSGDIGWQFRNSEQGHAVIAECFPFLFVLYALSLSLKIEIWDDGEKIIRKT